MAFQKQDLHYRVYLATSSGEFVAGEPDASSLLPTLAKYGIDARWVVWDDPRVDWNEPDLIAVRSTWDYQDKLPEFLTWAARMGSKLLHGERAFKWNTNKSYLLELAQLDVSTVPTEYATTEEDVSRLVGLGGRGKLVVKPVVGVSGIGVEIVEGGTAKWTPSSTGPWAIQPFIESVKTEGEYSVFIIGGEVTAQISKKPAAGNFLVHEEHGGHHQRIALTEEARIIAKEAYEAAERILGMQLGYARADLLRHDGVLKLTELEITEPQLYFDLIPEHGELFAHVLTKAMLSLEDKVRDTSTC